ncbi:uncharacterized protein LOC18448609 [Amborella trichopoda]|uniref:uncharacterized protein LOC18448609 n=1 Tax=Amborella trichopoda TaxID=13333 RepID=UPI0005D3473C|nr:uncharacterized protein LOC18448609 [Amborella trichopoda]|eukprot:XP_011628769.1 uncharacterized protein LOC18448609 [Amborella trichopoda]
MNSGRWRIFGPAETSRKDKDDDLLLFREMKNRDKEKVASLLQPVVSGEFEPDYANGTPPIFRIPSGKKGTGSEFWALDGNKNDYNWLKTPPGTPLFPSLEMEANNPALVIQREIPILKAPLTIKTSRFADQKKSTIGATKTNPNPKPASTSQRSPKSGCVSTSSSRSGSPSARRIATNSKATKVVSNAHAKTYVTETKSRPRASEGTASITSVNQICSDVDARVISPLRNIGFNTIAKHSLNGMNFSDSNEQHNVGTIGSKHNPERSPKPVESKPTRGLSPFGRSMAAIAKIEGFSNETPSNLRTTIPNRPPSNSRGRPGALSSEYRHRPLDETPSNLRSSIPNRSTSASRGRTEISNMEKPNKFSDETSLKPKMTSLPNQTNKFSDETSLKPKMTSLPNQTNKFSDETYLKPKMTSLPKRPASTTRGRSGSTKPMEETGKMRRQSCSPSTTRGRRPENERISDQNPLAKEKTSNFSGVPGVLGSKMVERVMNARRTGNGGNESQLKIQTSMDGSGFGRTMSRTSLNMALKHMVSSSHDQ